MAGSKGPCQVCGKPSGPCNIKPKIKSFFCINIIKDFDDHVKFPETTTNILRIPKRGDMFIYAREPDVPEVARLIQFHIGKVNSVSYRY
ncbi:hypothetical protein BRADI_2g45675v3 [Brachypodium distachyon]|uniref:Uncharacterized protein n=1 Tax=Brachypodium distachyon TaxID=15368 RepID=A0A2K2DE34_BRADI|nr:hypothetical protein BRADI_2g45675v3 [Brachypodium distachyon]